MDPQPRRAQFYVIRPNPSRPFQAPRNGATPPSRRALLRAGLRTAQDGRRFAQRGMLWAGLGVAASVAAVFLGAYWAGPVCALAGYAAGVTHALYQDARQLERQLQAALESDEHAPG